MALYRVPLHPLTDAFRIQIRSPPSGWCPTALEQSARAEAINSGTGRPYGLPRFNQ
jgi:hypothetical protein